MERIFAQLEHKKNFVFLGEAGSGKSELAVNFARQLARRTQREVHFFDLDMTKPLFRSRDAAGELEQAGVTHIRQFGDRRMTPPREGEQRVFFTAERNG